MPRTAARLTSVIFDNQEEKERIRLSIGSSDNLLSSRSDITDTKTGEIINIIHDANMDGVRHLKDDNVCIRYSWGIVIVAFVLLALFQISLQIEFYYRNPIATNVEAEYPTKIPFPAVAICNNNQFRLTYITGAWLMNRYAGPKGEDINSTLTVFERVLLNAWDMDAVKFLRNAAHSKSRMILGCTWPDGSACRLSDFRPIWTMTGLCWAINTNQMKPFHVSGSGSGHGLRLLLNVESYERIEACSEQFRTNRLPGVKILIYNQTDVPETSLSGVNVPAGFSMDIPFKMQHRHKLSGSSCVDEGDKERESMANFSSIDNIRTCVLRNYLSEIEKDCKCSFIRAFEQRDSPGVYPFCTVGDYFKCVAQTIERIREAGANAKGCRPSCKSIEFTAWQDMNRLPRNLMPPLIDEGEEDDESDVEEEDIENELYMGDIRKEHYTCNSNNRYLDDKQVARIKREAHRAFEKQSRYQEDVRERTKRIIGRLRKSMEKIINAHWGWHENELIGPYDRLTNQSSCFARLSSGENSISNRLSRPPPSSEESRTRHIHSLIDPVSFRRQPDRFKTLGALKEYYGQKVEDLLKEWNTVVSFIEKLWSIYDSSSYSTKIHTDLSRMDRIFELTSQYEQGGLQRRVWAEKMQSRQMRHFFEEEFMDGWSAPIMKDLDQLLMKTIHELQSNEWEQMNKSMETGTAYKIGATLFFAESSPENNEKFEKILVEMHECSLGEVKEESRKMLAEFKKAMRELQSAYNNLFKKELPDYLELYDFGDKFESDNFAMVNIFLHQMHLEHWRQYQTYSFWSLACDVGGALGLFVGASLLTIIEVIYLCFKYGMCSRKKGVKDAFKWVREASMRNKDKRRKGGMNERIDDIDMNDNVPEKKKSIWNGNGQCDTIPEETSLLTTTNEGSISDSVSESTACGLFSPTNQSISNNRQTCL